MGTYTDDQVMFGADVEGPGEEKPFLELQTQGLEKMLHILHRPDQKKNGCQFSKKKKREKVYSIKRFRSCYLTGKSDFMQKGSVLSESSCTNLGDAASFSC